MIFLNWLKVSALMLLCGLLTIGFSMDRNMPNGPSDDEKIIYGVINTVGKSLSAKHQMRQIGTGLGGMDKLWLVSLVFEKQDLHMTEQEARRLMVSCVDEFIEAVNTNQELRPLLKVYPFTAENISLAIHNVSSERRDPAHPFIATVSASRGKMMYLTRNKEQPIRYESEKQETFAEAVAILAEEKLRRNDGFQSAQ